MDNENIWNSIKKHRKLLVVRIVLRWRGKLWKILAIAWLHAANPRPIVILIKICGKWQNRAGLHSNYKCKTKTKTNTNTRPMAESGQAFTVIVTAKIISRMIQPSYSFVIYEDLWKNLVSCLLKNFPIYDLHKKLPDRASNTV